MGIILDGRFGCLYVYLGRYGIILDTDYMENKDLEENDILAFDKVVLYRINKDGEVFDETDYEGWHYSYVTSLSDDQIIVSSWGDKYIVDNSNSSETSFIRLKAH